MKTQTSLVAEQVRLQQWAEQIRDCQNRPAGVKIDDWCVQHGMSKANYYYRLRRVREACLTVCENTDPTFIELPKLTAVPSGTISPVSTTSAILRGPGGVTIEITNSASCELIRNAIGALAYAQ